MSLITELEADMAVQLSRVREWEQNRELAQIPAF